MDVTGAVLATVVLVGVASLALGYVMGRWRRVAAERDTRASLERTEFRFRDAIEVLDDGMTLWDARDRLVTWNARYLEMFPMLADALRPGVTFEACVAEVARRMYGHLSADDQASQVAERTRLHRDLVSPREYVRHDGMHVLVFERRTADGGTVSIYRDVTAEREATAALARSEAQFRDGIESMPDGFVLWGQDRRLRTWNDRLLQVMPHLKPILTVGMSIETFIEQACDAAYPDWSVAEREAWVTGRLKIGWNPAIKTTLALADDRFVTTTQRRTSDGGLVVTYHDVTADTRAARQLAASQAEAQRLALAATNMQTGVVILDACSRVIWMNPAMAEMIGQPPEAVIGKTPRVAYMSSETPPESLARIATALNAQRRIRADIVLRRPDGATLWVELDAAPIFGASGTLESIVGLHTDIAERKRRQAELEGALVAAREVNEQQRRFISIASHEFRTPLAVIDGAAQRIMSQIRDGKVDENAMPRLERIRGAISRMTGVIDLMLSSARLDEGRLELVPAPVDLAVMLRDVCERQRHITPQFEISFEDVPASMMIHADARLLEQVFSNLLSNAAKYSGASRRIEIGFAVRADAVDVSVQDFGIGIAADDLPRMFTRFFRAATAMGIPGTGIGLHFARELVQLHGGSIEVRSEVGRGTTILVHLPLDRPRADADPSVAA